MFIGATLKSRMDTLGITVEKLADEAILDIEFVQKIMNDKVSIHEIDEMDLEFISDVLYCKPEYFYDQSSKEKDLIYSAMNRGIDDTKSSKVKGNIQNFTKDFIFLKNIMSELEE
ncbi:MAG: hypothetical protein FH761_17960 [Firmicutes bacterium]|nr:hypothetical protein [Bacillota bacterium]